MLMHGEPIVVQDPLTGPADDEVLQFPSTASSGRRLILTTFGASYGFSLCGALGSFLIKSLYFITSAKGLCSTPAAATSARTRASIVQNRKKHRGAGPFADVDLFGNDSLS
jgi:hypothetical protein